VTAQVIYLPLARCKRMTLEDIQHVQKLQDDINSWRAKLANDTRSMAPGEQWICKQRFHARFREFWRIYEGFKEEQSAMRVY